jgi:hypothetical protein
MLTVRDDHGCDLKEGTVRRRVLTEHELIVIEAWAGGILFTDEMRHRMNCRVVIHADPHKDVHPPVEAEGASGSFTREKRANRREGGARTADPKGFEESPIHHRLHRAMQRPTSRTAPNECVGAGSFGPSNEVGIVWWRPTFWVADTKDVAEEYVKPPVIGMHRTRAKVGALHTPTSCVASQ